MLRHIRLCALSAILLCVFLSVPAQAEGTLEDLWDSGVQLLLHTENVTVDGEAEFFLDGERFKTAQVHYVQDGLNSYYGLKLLTPWPDGTEKETGWIIIGQETGGNDMGTIYVIEAYSPGVYHEGFDRMNKTLLRSTDRLDDLLALGRLLTGHMEAALPEGAVTESEAEGIRTVRIDISREQLPAGTDSVVNLAVRYLAPRVINVAVGTYVTEFSRYVSPTRALVVGTDEWLLNSVQMEASLDDQGRLTAAEGEIRVTSVYWDHKEREVTVKFSGTASAYGQSRVQPFDPADYGLRSIHDFWDEERDDIYMDENTWEQWRDKNAAIWARQGYSLDPDWEWSGRQRNGLIHFTIVDPDGDCFVTWYDGEGRLLILNHMHTLLKEQWAVVRHEKADDDDLAQAEALVRDFLAEYNPEFMDRLDGMKDERGVRITEDGSRYLVLSDEMNNEICFDIRIAPSPGIEYFCSVENYIP